MVTACVSCRMSVSPVRPGLFLSGLDSALNGSILSSRNITLVINASGWEGVAYPHLDGLQVFHVPVQDRPHAPLGAYFEPVAERIKQNQTGATLVHCVAGRSRSPTLVMAYLMRSAFFLLTSAAVAVMVQSRLNACVHRSEGLSLREAHEVVLESRQFVRPNAGFWLQLASYEKNLSNRTVGLVRTLAGSLPGRQADPDTPATDGVNM